MKTTGYVLEVFRASDRDFCVWIDVEGAPKQGICIGVGKKKSIAFRRAAKELSRASLVAAATAEYYRQMEG